MHASPRLASVAALAVCLFGCSSSSESPAPKDAGHDATPPVDASTPVDASSVDSAPPVDAAPTVTGMTILAADGGTLAIHSGDALPMAVFLTLSDGTVKTLPAGTQVAWTSPQTITAQDPDDAGPNGILPDTGATPTGFYVANPYRPERTDYNGTLFVIDPGTGASGTIAVTAVVGDAGPLHGSVAVTPIPAGDPDAGADLFQNDYNCAGCHGLTGDGSPPSDAGPDGAIVYVLQGSDYPYPAPGLNDTSPGGAPNLAADPAWNASLLGVAALSDMDNNGVALRVPMPNWLERNGVTHGRPTAQELADIYAYLKTQTQ